MAMVMGVDIGDKSWAVVYLETIDQSEFKEPDARSVPYDGDLGVSPGQICVIDIPIGLLDDEDASPTEKGMSGDREVDKAARKWCRSSSSVFPPPTKEQFKSAAREHLRAKTEGGKRKLRNVEPGGMSNQCLELVPAIDSARKLKDKFPDQVYESHPEVVFSALAMGILPSSKASLIGELARVAILTNRLGFDVLNWVMWQECSTDIFAHNWLDALAMAVVASDWTRQIDRKILKSCDGQVCTWKKESNGIIALPATELTGAPPRLRADAAMKYAKSISAAVRSQFKPYNPLSVPR